jgi:hypothetical protein
VGFGGHHPPETSVRCCDDLRPDSSLDRDRSDIAVRDIVAGEELTMDYRSVERGRPPVPAR